VPAAIGAAPQPEVVSAKVRMFPCAACGADVVWDPDSAVLKCPYCGEARQKPRSTAEVRPHPIEEGLRAPRNLGWGAARKCFRCTKCGATTTFEPMAAAGACAFCGTPAVIETPPRADLVRPEGVLAFRIGRDEAAQQFRSWQAGLWLRPNDLANASSLTKLQGVYVPFWTFDAATHTAWTAEVRPRRGAVVSVEQKSGTRWIAVSGTVEKLFDDLPAAASRGLDREMSRAIEPFPTSELVEYEPDYLSGFLAEEYAVDLKDALASAEERMRAEIHRDCLLKLPAGAASYRNLQIVSQFTGVAYKSVLLPVWISAYQYKGKPYRFLVNGVTGKTEGKAPWSPIKVALAIAAALIVAFIIFGT
jgi:DNA-directed RNA polymerase subunit RPC12/RpoP